MVGAEILTADTLLPRILSLFCLPHIQPQTPAILFLGQNPLKDRPSMESLLSLPPDVKSPICWRQVT